MRPEPTGGQVPLARGSGSPPRPEPVRSGWRNFRHHRGPEVPAGCPDAPDRCERNSTQHRGRNFRSPVGRMFRPTKETTMTPTTLPAGTGQTEKFHLRLTYGGRPIHRTRRYLGLLDFTPGPGLDYTRARLDGVLRNLLMAERPKRGEYGHYALEVLTFGTDEVQAVWPVSWAEPA